MLAALHITTICYWNNCLNSRSFENQNCFNTVRKINHEKYTFSRYFRAFLL